MSWRSRAALSFAALVVLATPASAQVPQSCWYPDGSTQAVDVPCDSQATASACCNTDAFCLGNGLCMKGGSVSRGSCTDKSWSDPACPKFCTDIAPSNGATLQPCGYEFTQPWACTTNSTACIDNDNTFLIGESANAIILRSYQVADLDSGSAHVLSIEPSTIITAEGRGSNSSGTGTGTSTGTSNSSDAMFTTGQMVGVGVGVGIPLLLALLAAIIIILRQRKQLQRRGFTSAAASSLDTPLMQRNGMQDRHGSTDYPSLAYTSKSPQPQFSDIRAGRQYGEEMDTTSHQLNEVDGRPLRPELDGESQPWARGVGSRR